jgi:hypothetical protein
MTAEPPLPLRKVAQQLGQIKQPAGKPAVSELLGLLKSGELMAGFEFPGTKVCWIPIPTSYWTGISSHKFGSLRYLQHDKHKTGTYEVQISDFVDEYLQVVRHQFQGKGSDAAITMLYDEFRKALTAAPRPYEVGITNEEWTKYLKRHPIPASAMQQKRSASGRHPKTSWHHLAPIIGAYLMTLDNRPSGSRDHYSIAASVLEVASKEGIADLPAVETLRDLISKAFAKAGELSKP